MAKHSRRERERRAQETERVREIEAAWFGSLPAETAKAFTRSVEAARARPPAERPAAVGCEKDEKDQGGEVGFVDHAAEDSARQEGAPFELREAEGEDTGREETGLAAYEVRDEAREADCSGEDDAIAQMRAHAGV